MNIPKRVVQPENISYFNITWWQTGKTKGVLLFATILGTSVKNANLFRGDFEIHKPWHYGSIIIPVREEPCDYGNTVSHNPPCWQISSVVKFE